MSRLPPLMVLWIMCLAAVLPGHVSAASITNYFGGSWDWPLHTLTINVGDTVLWINQQPRFIGSNYVETFTAEFKSPLLDEGNSFSFTFTKSGFYAYRTGTHKHAPVTPGNGVQRGNVHRQCLERCADGYNDQLPLRKCRKRNPLPSVCY